MNEFILKKIATNAHLQGKINISNVPLHLLPQVGQIVDIVLDDEIFKANFIYANSYRINNVNIGHWLQIKNIRVGSAYSIKISNNNTFEFLLNE